MSSRGIPLATRVPRKGGEKTGLSETTSGDLGGSVAGSIAARTALLRGGSLRPVGTVPNVGSIRPLAFSSISWSSVRKPSKASLP